MNCQTKTPNSIILIDRMAFIWYNFCVLKGKTNAIKDCSINWKNKIDLTSIRNKPFINLKYIFFSRCINPDRGRIC